MGRILTKTIDITTAADGSATEYSHYFSGRVLQIQYIKTDFADGVDFAITVDGTGEGLWTESNVNASTFRRPRTKVHDDVGVAAELSGSTMTYLREPAVVFNDRVKFVIASGGAAKTGRFKVIYEFN